MSKSEEPAIGIPYNPAYQAPAPPPQQQYFVQQNPYQAGVIPPNAIVGDPKGIPIQQTMYRDTPAPFNCIHCGNSGLTLVKLWAVQVLTSADLVCQSPSSMGVSVFPFQIIKMVVSRSKPSLAACVGCMMPMMLGVCFLCPSMDCLWHKYHYCPSCKEKVADFEKSDPCIVMDPPQWKELSFALPG
nr:GSH-induced LITAF domain protein [Ipomoea batatas]